MAGQGQSQRSGALRKRAASLGFASVVAPGGSAKGPDAATRGGRRGAAPRQTDRSSRRPASAPRSHRSHSQTTAPPRPQNTTARAGWDCDTRTGGLFDERFRPNRSTLVGSTSSTLVQSLPARPTSFLAESQDMGASAVSARSALRPSARVAVDSSSLSARQSSRNASAALDSLALSSGSVRLPSHGSFDPLSAAISRAEAALARGDVHEGTLLDASLQEHRVSWAGASSRIGPVGNASRSFVGAPPLPTEIPDTVASPSASSSGDLSGTPGIFVEPPVVPMPMPMPMQTPMQVPGQLEVLHLQRAAATDDGGIIVALPQVAALPTPGFAPESFGATVVLLPDGSAGLALGELPRAPPQEPLVLEAPPLPPDPADRLKSVSQRLKALVGEVPAASPPTQAPSSRHKLLPAEILPPENPLKNLRLSVLSQVDVLTDAVLQHILSDTVLLLDRLPDRNPPPAEESPPEEPLIDESLPSLVAREAAERLAKMEREMAWRYTIGGAQSSATTGVGGYTSGGHTGPSVGPAIARPHIRGAETFSLDPLKLTMGQQSGLFGLPALDATNERGARIGAASLGGSSCLAPDYCAPAALPLERVRAIDSYRKRFRHHCAAVREAGIDVGATGTASTATWLIWPRLADEITMSVIELAIEEVHEAFERHVDDMVQEEVGMT